MFHREDGYPTEATIKSIEKWNHARGFRLLLDCIKDIWEYSDCGFWAELQASEISENFSKNDACTYYYISTGGWSGNEEIIGALMRNTMFWMLHWVQSRRGGHYIFEVKKDDVR